MTKYKDLNAGSYIKKYQRDELISNFYDIYSKMVNPERATPDIRDGMRLVERRIFYFIMKNMPDKKLKKSAWVVGNVMANYHPHGDMSIYNTLIDIVNSAPFLIEGQGNWGNNKTLSEEPASAMRYTECKKGTAFNQYFMLSNISPLIIRDTENKEPEFMIVPIPYALLSGFTGIGVGKGFKIYIPKYKFDDLVSHLKYTLNKKGKKEITPYFDDDELIIEAENKSILLNGKGKIIVYGKYHIDKNKIIITNKPPYFKDNSITSILNKVKFNVNVDDYSHNKTQIILSTQTKNIKELEKHVKDKLKTIFNVNIITFTGSEYKKIGVTEWLRQTFEIYQQYKEKDIQKKIAELEIEVEIKKILKKYIPIYKKNLNKINSKNDYINFVKDTMRRLNIDEVLMNKILNIPNNKLLTISTDIEKLKQQILAYKEQLKNITSLCLNDIEEIKKLI